MTLARISWVWLVPGGRNRVLGIGRRPAVRVVADEWGLGPACWSTLKFGLLAVTKVAMLGREHVGTLTTDVL